MEKKEYSVLILGNFESFYVVQYVKNLKKYNPQAHLFFWGYTREKNDTDRSFLSCYDEYCLFDIKKELRSSTLGKLSVISKLRKSFKTFVEGKHFDYVNIHYIKPEYCFLLDYLKKCASKLVLTPWGSDVLAVKYFYKYLVRQLFDSADFVTGEEGRFTQDVKRLFNVPENKIVHCVIGFEPIEYIIEHKKLTDTNEAKHHLKLDNHYVITCGYNANRVHRHSEIIDSINQVRHQFPDNLLLVFPFTYPKVPEYIQTIKQKVNDYGLNAVYFEDFLDMQHLFFLRQATDIFIHVQPTDASSASLWEYILCEKKIINGSWLQYPELVKNGKLPYFELDKMENLGKKVVETYLSAPIEISQELFKDFEKKQWKVAIKDWDKLFSSNLS